MSDLLNNPTDHLAAVQAAQALSDSPTVQELTKPSRQIAAKHLARTTDIIMGAFNALLSPFERYHVSQNAVTSELGAQLHLDRQVADFQRTIFFEELQKKAEQIPQDRLQSPPVYIAGPALQAMLFTIDAPELRQFYVNLLGTSMDGSKVRTAHPAFVDVIRQLSPDEARILKVLEPGVSWPEIDILSIMPDDADAFETVAHHVSWLGERSGCTHCEFVPVYVDNLCRLGTVTIPYGGYLADESAYLELRNHPSFVAQEQIALTLGRQIRSRRAYVELTGFGRLFWEACVAS